MNKLVDLIFNSYYINTSNKTSIIGFKNGSNLFLVNYLEKYGVDEINKFLIRFNFPFTIEYEKGNSKTMFAFKYASCHN